MLRRGGSAGTAGVAAIVLVFVLAAAGARAVEHRRLGIVPCVLHTTTYHPTELERGWNKQAKAWGDDYCTHVVPHIPDIEKWLKAIEVMMSSAAPHHRVNVDALSHLSYFTYTYDCGGKEQVYRIPIEPLFGGLRHPLTLCTPVDYLLDKSYMLLASGYAKPQFSNPDAKAYIFDLGASTYTQGAGGASQKWFVDVYQSRGIKFDQYFGWESAQHSAKEVLDEVPKSMLARYNYYNIPAPTGIDDEGNPLNMMKSVAKKEDFVVLKIDIDRPQVELEFVQQILDSPNLIDLIDEFFFEHHVNFGPMNTYWRTSRENQTLADSYHIFSLLRQHGVRAHGWV